MPPGDWADRSRQRIDFAYRGLNGEWYRLRELSFCGWEDAMVVFRDELDPRRTTTYRRFFPGSNCKNPRCHLVGQLWRLDSINRKQCLSDSSLGGSWSRMPAVTDHGEARHRQWEREQSFGNADLFLRQGPGHDEPQSDILADMATRCGRLMSRQTLLLDRRCE
ncbi:hypothetical protein H0G86_006071 [Trichoderma simmonsii]|uniref:Uncharacterized protein n=1 Tax=Trichoderma simmonsii TaxID=1491479 RepID=A0A8G0LFU3_9HYPO|nr:hypothetical protein H0G86_006071 [Trichoderma simmonsii]